MNETDIVSFVDDIKSQSSLVRLIIQLTAMAILFYAVGLYFEPWWILILAFIFSVAVVNAYNFMDGINGITALNSFVVLGSLIIVNQDEGFDYHNISLIQVMISVVIFSIYNFRTKAKCFAGDVGSISMSFIILYALLDLIFKKGFHFEYIQNKNGPNS